MFSLNANLVLFGVNRMRRTRLPFASKLRRTNNLENLLQGAPRIHSELLKLGSKASAFDPTCEGRLSCRMIKRGRPLDVQRAHRPTASPVARPSAGAAC